MDVPLTDFGRVAKDALEGEMIVDGDLVLLTRGDPLLDELVAEGGGEGPRVGDGAGTKEDVAYEVDLVLVELL